MYFLLINSITYLNSVVLCPFLLQIVLPVVLEVSNCIQKERIVYCLLINSLTV